MSELAPAAPAAPWHRPASVVAAAGLAVSQPVLGILGDNPEFFIARSSPRVDALVVAGLLGIIVPMLAGGAVYVIGRLHVAAGVVAHALVFGALSGWVVAQVVDAMGVGVLGTITAGAVGAVLLVAGYNRLEALRWVMRSGALVPVAVLFVFVFVSPTSAVILGGDEPEAVGVTIERPLPVVVLVLDELPTASLLADPDTINAERFPNIAALAAEGVWYRGATSVAARSNLAIPAILSGRYPAHGMIPSFIDWPVNLMTILADSHEVHAREPVTGLCPPSVCDDSQPLEDEVAPAGVVSLLSDVRLVGLHVTIPERLTEGLPPIDQTWGNFGGGPGDDWRLSDFDDEVIRAQQERFQGLLDEANAEVEAGRADDFDGWVTTPGTRPDLYVLHTLMPHKPWEYTPSGERYADVPRVSVDDDDLIVEDDWRRRFDERRHLLQVGHVDRMVGTVLDDLRAFGIYDEALIVLVADHGEAFVPGEHDREPDQRNIPLIADVPLIIKYPGGPAGIVDDRPAMIIDILPTVIDVLGIRGVPEVEGSSLRGPVDHDRVRRYVTAQGLQPLDWDPNGLADAVADRRQSYGSDPSWDAIWHPRPYADLVGREIPDSVPRAHFRVAYDRAELLERVPGPGGLVPTLFGGGVAFDRSGFEELPYFAVVVNDRIAAIARLVERTTSEGGPFLALVPPGAFDARDNDVRVLLIRRGDDGDVELVGASNE